GAPETLDRRIGAPARLEQEMYAAGLALSCKIGEVAAPRAARIGEDQDALDAVHKGLRRSDIGARAAGLELLPPVQPDNQPPAAAGHLGDLIDAGPFEDRIEGGGDRR